ncbi:MAG: M42 family metallopeptidase [Chloroflexota bacterium]
MKETIKQLTEAYGPSGYETQVRELLQQMIHDEGLARGKGDDIRVDALGNLIVLKKGSGGGKKVMLAGHMDEIGVVVTHVDKEGFLRFSNVGGVRPHTLLGGRVRFADGAVGIIGLEKMEDPARLPGLDKFYIDVGAADKASCPVRVGDLAGFSRPFEELGQRLVAKAMDDRIGCAVILQVLRELETSPHDVYYVFTVQEEVGLRGATTSGYGIAPDLALAVDITLTGDTPEAATMAVSLGDGPAIKVKDGGMLAHPGVKNWLIETAEANGIPYQLEVLTGGTTDARAIQLTRAGVPAGCVSIPCRYAHTPSEVVDYGDVTGAVGLLVAALSKPIELA